MTIGFLITSPFSMVVVKKFGFRRTLFLESLFLGLSVIASSFSPYFWLFAILFGLSFGLIHGLMYMVPIYIACRNFPSKKGLVTGIVLSAYGFGTMLTNFLILGIINPNNIKPINFKSGTYFEGDVAQVALKLPKTLRIVGAYFMILGCLGSLLLKNKNIELSELLEENNENTNEKHKSQIQNLEENENINIIKEECQSKMDALKSGMFYIIYFMFMCSLMYEMLMSANYKQYGFNQLGKEGNDKFLTTVGSVSGF